MVNTYSCLDCAYYHPGTEKHTQERPDKKGGWRQVSVSEYQTTDGHWWVEGCETGMYDRCKGRRDSLPAGVLAPGMDGVCPPGFQGRGKERS